MAERLTFTLAGRDELSRVLDGTADSADRLRLQLAGITADSDGRLQDLQGRFLTLAEAQRLVEDQSSIVRRSMTNLSDASGKLGESLKANLISLLPAAIPAAAGLTSSAAALAGQLGAVGVAAGAYALALGPQISAIGEATDAQKKYDEAVEQHGAHSQEARKAQADYQRQLEKLPPATREAAVAVGLLKDNYQEWSDSLSDDVMAPFTKGVAVANALLPETTGLVKGASTQFDRLITLVGGAITTPGFDALSGRFERFTNETLDHGVDRLTVFLAKLQSGDYSNSDLQQWWDYAQAAGPVVFDTLENVAEALLHVLEAGSGVGAGMLEVVNVLAAVVTAVPPEAIATLLQLAIAVKAVRLAAAGAAAGQAAVAALGVQIAAMRAAAAGAPGPLAGTAAAIGALSRTAKFAVAGTGIGLLLLALNELSQIGETTPPDVDKLTTSLGELGRTGKATGYVASQFGDGFGKLREQIQAVIDPSVADSINNWGADITNGLLDASDSTEKYKESVGSIDQALANLVSGGKADQAALALTAMTKGMNAEQVARFRGELDSYGEALAGQRLEQELAAQSMGIFGAQAQQVQAELESQKSSADGLRQSIVALNEVHRQGLDAQAAFEESVDNASAAAREYGDVWAANGGKLDLTTEKGRGAYRALSDLAAKTNEATTAASESGAAWSQVNSTFERGRQQLIRNAVQMGLTRGEAKALADQILRTPDKTARLRGDMQDLQAKIDRAKERLRTVPDSRRAQVRAEISQLTRQLEAARRQLNAIDGKTATTYIVTQYKVQGATGETRNLNKLRPGSYAQGGLIKGYADGGPIPGYPDGGLLYGPGTPTSDSILLWGSTGEYMVKAASVARYGLQFMDALNRGELPIGKSAPRAGRPAAVPSPAAATGGDRPAVTYNLYPRQSVISASDLELITRQEEARMRVGRPG
ncbi:hypothetical protein [Streptomyces sp. NPDC016626]|uniref:hypothetical protein n=1 Tax=Streptomyces sp. NPDC016626 TaxID=3364968 RepID=UPI0037010129